MDCLIIGGGPAGLTAAIYLARFNRKVAVIDDGNSRARLIPRTRNYPGFAEGITGLKLLETLREQAEIYGATQLSGRVERLEKLDGQFTAHWADQQRTSTRVIIATGLIDKAPRMPRLGEAIARGLVRYCPICDGFEASDQRIAVLGHGADACGKALFLRSYSNSVTLLTVDGSTPDAAACDELENARVSRPAATVASIELGRGDVEITLADGERRSFDTLYPVLGCQMRSELATALGAAHNDIGCLIVDQHQQTTVDGLFAIGDVVSDLHQIVVAAGHAALAATRVHNSLPRNLKPEIR